MFEAMATLAVLMIGGICFTFVAVAGLLFVSLIKLIFFPVTIALELVKWIALLVIIPVLVFVVAPLVLLALVPLMLGLVAVGGPLLIVGLVGFGMAHTV